MNRMKRYGIWYKIVFTISFSLCLIFSQAGLQHREFNVSTFYNTLQLDNLSDIETQLSIIKEIASLETEAYEGALLMKKAGLIKKPKDKINLFKKGHQKLETIILKDSGNIEYRFLRVIIQEHAPKIVKYNTDLDEDCILIRNNFKKLSSNLQQIALSYSKKSTVLKLP
ncbi:MAG: hypothetical protein NTZ19_00955 [Bacteroidetes bacterium]|nr:hypothetical protein [Bacteroidota bacterium]